MSLSKQVQERLLNMKRRMVDPRMKAALERYQKRLRFEEEPEGEKRFGIWFPSAQEQKYCCNKIFKRGINSNKDLYDHCMSHTHVAFMHGVSAAMLFYEINLLAEKDQLKSLLAEEGGEVETD